MILKQAEYGRVLTFDLSTVCRNMAGPSNPHRRLPTSDLESRGIAVGLDKANAEEAEGKMPDGAVIIAAITSCTNTSNPRNMVAAGLIARKANELGLIRKPWVKSSFRTGFQGSPTLSGRIGPVARVGKARLWYRGFRLYYL